MDEEYKIRITDLENAVIQLKKNIEEYFNDLEKGDVAFARVTPHTKKGKRFQVQLSKIKSERLKLKRGDIVLIQKPKQDGTRNI